MTQIGGVGVIDTEEIYASRFRIPHHYRLPLKKRAAYLGIPTSLMTRAYANRNKIFCRFKNLAEDTGAQKSI